MTDTKHIGIYIDLTVVPSIKEGLQATKEGWDELVTSLKGYLSKIDHPNKAEVVIKQKDGSLTTMTFEELAKEVIYEPGRTSN